MKKILSDIGEHIVNGIKYTLPLIVVYSVFSAIVNAGYITIGINLSDYIFLLLIPILTAFLVNSIIKKALFIPGIILGYFLGLWGLGYLGGIIGGLLFGYMVKYVFDRVTLKNRNADILFRYVLMSIIGFIMTYLIMYFIFKPMILYLLDSVRWLIDSLGTERTFIIVILLSSFTVLDLGGPFNKIAYSFIIQFYTEGYFHIIGPVLVSVMMPPLAVFFSLLLFKDRFNDKDQSSKYLALVGGLFGLTEGALLVGYRRPLKIIPILVLGSVVASTLASILGLTNNSLLVGLPSLLTINSIFIYLICVVVGLIIILGLFYVTLPNKKSI